MTLAADGQMSAGGNVANRSINLELGRAFNFPNSAIGSAAFRTLAGVPSGAIRLGADFYGKSNFTVGYSQFFVNDIVVDDIYPLEGGAGAGIRWKTDGTIDYFSATYGYQDSSDYWGSPTTAGIGSNYWIRFTRTAFTLGSSNFSTANTGFLQMNFNNEILIQKSPATDISATYTIEIASDSGGSNILTTRTGITIQLSSSFN